MILADAQIDSIRQQSELRPNDKNMSEWRRLAKESFSRPSRNTWQTASSDCEAPDEVGIDVPGVRALQLGQCAVDDGAHHGGHLPKAARLQAPLAFAQHLERVACEGRVTGQVSALEDFDTCPEFVPGTLWLFNGHGRRQVARAICCGIGNRTTLVHLLVPLQLSLGCQLQSATRLCFFQ